MSNYKDFLKNFEKSIIKNKRDTEDVEIIAVSKRQSEENILPIIALGHRSFGENQLQEVIKKWPNLKDQFSNIKIHFIGNIQSKKIHDVVQYCDVIHTLDREKILSMISKMDYDKIHSKTFFVQVNTGNEAQKSGVNLEHAEDFIQKCKNYNINIHGLMCIPPENDQPEKHFQILQSIAKNNNIKYLSMGMSNDYDIALKYGATHIRIGTSIFGIRN